MSEYNFVFKPFNEMTEKDYEEIGFMSGLEVHQQLLTEKKLFCRCPAGIYSKDFNAEILRHMRPTLSELGEYDGTALMEFKTKKDIIYRINQDTVCTYEMDDTPPFPMNENALDIAFEIALLVNSTIVDELHIARKQYLDGSIPTGFQRTAIVSVGGKIPYKDRDINIIQMSIEEDSCREVSDVGHRRVYLTDRLGMPLLETVTAPEMKTPQEVADVGNIIRRLARSTGNVRTGIGAARQDVNVSVRGGTRIEIKGVSKIKNIPLLTYHEAMRQWNLLRLREELHRRGITPDTFEAEVGDITHLLRKTYYPPIHNAISSGKVVKCVVLRGFKELLRWRTQTDTYFSREITDRIRVIACLTTLPNNINSDSYENTLTTMEGQKIRKFLGAKEDDTLIIIWGSEEDTATAVKEAIIRAKEATIGVPSETRQALREGTNGFERILPGAERMYPDTDLPPKKILRDRIDKIRLELPVRYWERERWYHALGIPKDVIEYLSVSEYAVLFEKAVTEWELDPVLVSVFLIQYPKMFKKKGYNIEILNEEIFSKILEAFRNKKLLKEGLKIALKNILEKGSYDDDLLPSPTSTDEFKEILHGTRINIDSIDVYHPRRFRDYLMGEIMQKLQGRISSEQVSAFVNEKLGKVFNHGNK